MSTAEHRDFYRRTALRCLAAFVFWFMGVMLAAYFITGAVFNPTGQTPMPLGITIGVLGGVLLAVRVYQMAGRDIKNSLEREPGGRSA